MKRSKALEVKNLKQYFKVGVGGNKLLVKAVDDVTFDIYEGEVFGLVGESGSGKTTTGRTIIKLYDATDGEVFFKGKRIGAGIQSGVQNIKDIKNQAKIDILNNQADLLALSNLKLTFKADLFALKTEFNEKRAGLDKTDKEKVAEAKKAYADKKSERTAKYQADLKALKEAIKNDPAKYARNEEKIAQIIEKRKAEVAEIKAEISVLKKDNRFAGETYETMKKIQMIFQDPISSLNPRMTVREIIAEGLKISGVRNRQAINERVFQALKTVGLTPEHAFRYPHEFSGGQRQRIGIARALVVEPELLIADEPISALDVSIQAQVINLLKELQEKLSLTILFIAHDLSVVKYFSDRIAVMFQGKIVELAEADAIFTQPLHPYTKSLLSAIPQPDPNYEKTRKRFTYVPQKSHNYTADDQPSMVEIEKGHFVYASPSEVVKYKAEMKKYNA